MRSARGLAMSPRGRTCDGAAVVFSTCNLFLSHPQARPAPSFRHTLCRTLLCSMKTPRPGALFHLAHPPHGGRPCLACQRFSWVPASNSSPGSCLPPPTQLTGQSTGGVCISREGPPTSAFLNRPRTADRPAYAVRHSECASKLSEWLAARPRPARLGEQTAASL